MIQELRELVGGDDMGAWGFGDFLKAAAEGSMAPERVAAYLEAFHRLPQWKELALLMPAPTKPLDACLSATEAERGDALAAFYKYLHPAAAKIVEQSDAGHYRNWKYYYRATGFMRKLPWDDSHVDKSAAMSIAGRAVCFSGDFRRTGWGKADMERLVLEVGGALTRGVTPQTEFLVLGAWGNDDDAAALGVPLICEEQFVAALKRELGVESAFELDCLVSKLRDAKAPISYIASRPDTYDRVRQPMEPVDVDELLERAENSMQIVGKLICITGTLDRKRAEYERLIQDAGGVFTNTLKVGVDYLVIGEKAGGGKLSQAKRYGTKVCQLRELQDALGIPPPRMPALK